MSKIKRRDLDYNKSLMRIAGRLCAVMMIHMPVGAANPGKFPSGIIMLSAGQTSLSNWNNETLLVPSDCGCHLWSIRPLEPTIAYHTTSGAPVYKKMYFDLTELSEKHWQDFAAVLPEVRTNTMWTTSDELAETLIRLGAKQTNHEYAIEA
jgi:hypothetical protein